MRVLFCVNLMFIGMEWSGQILVLVKVVVQILDQFEIGFFYGVEDIRYVKFIFRYLLFRFFF